MDRFVSYYDYAAADFESDHGPTDAYWEAEWQPYLSKPAYQRAAEKYAAEHGFRRYAFNFVFGQKTRILYARSKEDARLLITQGLESA